MGKKDHRVDAYIERAADYATPILRQLRKTIHAACPKVEETIKWGAPFFVHHGILCATPAFKKHTALIFWHKGLRDSLGAIGLERDALKKLRRLSASDDLPPAAVLKKLVKLAAALNESGVKSPPRTRRKPKPALPVPADLKRALAANQKARATFEGFTPGKRNEYIEWLSEAKRDETREKRLATAIGWMAQGKSRNWKYKKR